MLLAPVTRGFSSPSYISPVVGVEQEVELEVAAVALLPQALAHRHGALAGQASAAASVSTSGKTSLPHQPPS